jgi:DNA-binding protein Fis
LTGIRQMKDKMTEDELRAAEQDALWRICEELSAYHDTRPVDLSKEVSELEQAEIERALKACEDNQTQAAKLLKLNRTTLLAKMKKYDI